MKNTQSGTRDLTKGNVFGTLIIFSLPFMASNILQTLYSMVDMMIVGNVVGSAGLSALSTGSQIMEMAVVMLIGFTMGGQVLISQNIGAGKKERVPQINGTLTTLTLAASVVFTILGITCGDFLLTLLNTPEEAFAYAHDYVTIYSCGLLFTGMYNMISAIFRAQGDSRHPLIFVMIATLVNVVLDLLFVVVLGWAAAGAAFATIIGQAVSVIFSVSFLLRNQEEFYFRFERALFVPNGRISSNICKLGIPMALQNSAVHISFLFVSSMINALGVTVSAAFGAMQKIRNVPGFILQSFSMGANAMIGQNYGAGKYDRIRRIVMSSIGICAVIGAAFAVLYWTFPKAVFSLFTSEEAVLAYASMCMFCIISELPAKITMSGGGSLVGGIGNIKLSMTLSLVDAIIGRIGMTWLFGSFLGMGVFGYLIGYTSATYLTAIPQMIYFFSGMWTRRKRNI